ncbi:hypothetical protein [Intestinibacter sp.]
MKNKLLVLMLAFLMVLGVVGCSKKNNENSANQSGTVQNQSGTTENTANDEYYNVYTKNYNASLEPLANNYSMYGNIDRVEEYYKENNYPGNEKYLEEVRTALTESRDNVEQFIDNMEKDAKSDNEQINKLNKNMIEDGRDLVEKIDERLKKLDEISDKDLQKSDTEFRRIVGEHIMLEEESNHDFRKMLKDLDKELNIDRKDMLDTTK